MGTAVVLMLAGLNDESKFCADDLRRIIGRSDMAAKKRRPNVSVGYLAGGKGQAKIQIGSHTVFVFGTFLIRTNARPSVEVLTRLIFLICESKEI